MSPCFEKTDVVSRKRTVGSINSEAMPMSCSGSTKVFCRTDRD